MRRNEFLRDITEEIDWNSLGLSSTEQLIQNSTDASFIAALDETTGGIRLIRFQNIKTNKKAQMKESI